MKPIALIAPHATSAPKADHLNRSNQPNRLGCRKMISRLFLLIALSGLGSGNVEEMYKVIKGYVQLTEDYGDPMEALFKYALPKFRCIQLVSDNSPFADHAMEHIYHSFGVPSITRGYFGESVVCEGFVILVGSTLVLLPVLQKYPLYFEHRFILILPPVSDSKILELNKKLASFGDSEILIATTRNLSMAYRLGQPDRDELEFVDDFREPWEVEDVILDFNGRKINALTYNCSLFSQIGPLNPDKSANFTYGAEAEVFIDLAESLNLRIEWQVLENMPVHSMFFQRKKWYTKALIEKGKPTSADVAFCGLTLTYKMLLSDIETSTPLISLCFRFLVPRPKVIQTEWNSIFTVFKVEIWVTIVIATLITSVILQRVTTYTKKFIHTEGISQYTKLGGSAMQLLSILVLSDVPPSTELQGACRYILSFWSFSSMILATIFSSGLISNLTTQRYANKIDTVEELFDKNMQWGFRTQPDFSELLNTRGNLVHARLKMRALQMKSLQDYEDHLRRGNMFLWGAQVLNGFFLPEEDLPEDILDDYEVSDNCFITYFISFAFRPGSPYHPAFDQLIITYRETGLLKKEFARVMRAYRRRHPYSTGVLQLTAPTLSGGSLKLYHLTGIIEVWALGMAVAIIVFILEIFQKCYI